MTHLIHDLLVTIGPAIIGYLIGRAAERAATRLASQDKRVLEARAKLKKMLKPARNPLGLIGPEVLSVRRDKQMARGQASKFQADAMRREIKERFDAAMRRSHGFGALEQWGDAQRSRCDSDNLSAWQDLELRRAAKDGIFNAFSEPEIPGVHLASTGCELSDAIFEAAGEAGIIPQEFFDELDSEERAAI